MVGRWLCLSAALALGCLSPARDLSGTWRGGFHYREDNPNPACDFSGPMTLVLTQKNKDLQGTVTIQATEAVPLLEGVEGLCQPTGQTQRAVLGNVSASSVTLGELTSNLLLTGSFTTDLMGGTLTSGTEIRVRGCWQVGRHGDGLIPDCHEPGPWNLDAGVLGDAGAHDAGARDAGALDPDASAAPTCAEPVQVCAWIQDCPAGMTCVPGADAQRCCSTACAPPCGDCLHDEDCCGSGRCLGASTDAGPVSAGQCEPRPGELCPGR